MYLGEVYIEPEMARIALLCNSLPVPPKPRRRQANPTLRRFSPTFLTPLPSTCNRVHFDDPSIEEELSE